MSLNISTSYEAFFSYPALIHPTLHLRINGSTATSSTHDSAHPPRCTLCTTVYMNDRLFIDPFELEDKWGPPSCEMEMEFERNNDPYHVETVTQNTFPCAATEAKIDLWSQTKELPASIRWALDPEVPDLERPVRYHFQRKLPPPRRIYKPVPALEDPDHPYEAVLCVSRRFEARRGVEIDIPTHMRYQEPSNESYRIVKLGDIASLGERPPDLLLSVFWDCQEKNKMQEAIVHSPHNPANMTRLSLASSSAYRKHEIALPTAIASHVAFVPPITFLVVMLSWLYVARALIRLWKRSTSAAEGKIQ